MCPHDSSFLQETDRIPSTLNITVRFQTSRMLLDGLSTMCIILLLPSISLSISKGILALMCVLGYSI